MKAISLFSGMGGDSLGLHNAGIAGGNNPINKIFSENLPLEISLSNLLRNSNLDPNNIELGGLPRAHIL